VRRQALLRFLETAFRRWWLFAIPLVAMLVLAVLTVGKGSPSYVSTAVARAADQTVLSELEEDSNRVFRYDTPAEIASRQINESMRTDTFMNSVLQRAGIELGQVPGLFTLDQVRGAVNARPAGEQLVTVRAGTSLPEASQRLSQSTLDTYTQTVIDETVAESAAAEAFYRGLLPQYTQDVEDARQALSQFIVDFPPPADGERPFEQEIAIEELTAATQEARTRQAEIVAKIEEAQLTIERTRADIQQQLKVIDEPDLPRVAESTRKDSITTVAIYLIVGAIIALVAIAVATFLDRSIRGAADARNRLGVEVLATVPYRRRRKSAPSTPASPTESIPSSGRPKAAV
jgi:hypothetical protein